MLAHANTVMRVCVTGKRLRLKIKELTNRPVTAQRLIFSGRPIQFEDTVGDLKLTSGVVINCFPKESTPEEEEQAMRSEGSGQLSFPSQQQSAGMRSVGGVGVSAGRGLGAIGGGGGLMSMEDDRRSDGSGSTSTGRAGDGMSQDDDPSDWEAVGKKKKATGVGKAAVSHDAVPKDAVGGKLKDGKMHFFGLWVGNVHSQVVDQEELRANFERFGELCNSRVHGVPPINILPDSSSAFVNFCRYEDADAARNALQGRTVAGTGPLRINASDLMQSYEDKLKSQGGLQTMASAPQSRAPGASGGGGTGGGGSMWNSAPGPALGSSVWGGGGSGIGSAGGGGAFGSGLGGVNLTPEEKVKLAKLEQERQDEELARQLAKQEQYEASNAFYIQQARQRTQQAGASARGGGAGGGTGYGGSNFMYEAGPGMEMGGGLGGSSNGGGRGVIGGSNQIIGGTSDFREQVCGRCRVGQAHAARFCVSCAFPRSLFLHAVVFLRTVFWRACMHADTACALTIAVAHEIAANIDGSSAYPTPRQRAQI